MDQFFIGDFPLRACHARHVLVLFEVFVWKTGFRFERGFITYLFIRFTKFVSELSRDSIRSKLRKIPERRKIYNLVVLQSSVLAAKGNPCKIIGQGRKTSLIASNASCTCSIER